jgi:hypothetical protein
LAEGIAEGKWEYGHLVNDCTKMDAHAEDCDGNCSKVPAMNSVVDLHNEAIEWNKRGMVVQGVPSSLSGGPFPGISVEIFELECRFAGLIRYLKDEWDEFDEGKASDCYRKVMIEKMRYTREKYDEAQREAEIAIAKPPLLGPNGEVLH